ncbi:hypothetical protein [Streptomyces hawaiiensis]
MQAVTFDGEGDTGSLRLLEKHGFQWTGTVRHGEDEHLVFVLP